MFTPQILGQRGSPPKFLLILATGYNKNGFHVIFRLQEKGKILLISNRGLPFLGFWLSYIQLLTAVIISIFGFRIL